MEYKLKKKHAERVSNAINELNAVMKEIKKYIPEANYYLEDTANFMVLSGDSHDDDRNCTARQDRVLQHDYLMHAGGGAW